MFAMNSVCKIDNIMNQNVPFRHNAGFIERSVSKNDPAWCFIDANFRKLELKWLKWPFDSTIVTHSQFKVDYCFFFSQQDVVHLVKYFKTLGLKLISWQQFHLHMNSLNIKIHFYMLSSILSSNIRGLQFSVKFVQKNALTQISIHFYFISAWNYSFQTGPESLC